MRSFVCLVASASLVGVLVAACGSTATSSPPPEPTSSPEGFATAQALLRAGYVADAATAAEEALKRALETDPFATLPPDLKYLPGQGSPISQLLDGHPSVRAFVALLGDVVGAVVAAWPAMLAVLALALIARRRWSLRMRLSMGTVAGAAPGDDSKKDDEPDLAGPIAVEIDRLRQEGAGASLGLASGVDAALTMPAPVAAAAPAAAWLAALADLVGHPRAELSGTIGADRPPSGRDITLSLRWSDGKADTVSLAAREYTELPPPGDPGATKPPPGSSMSGVVSRIRTTAALPDATALELLGLASAVWVAYELSPKDRRWPTADWRSFALTRAGAALYEDGERERPRWLHTEALARDPDNRAALFNLGALDTNTDPEVAVARLTRARVLVEAANLAGNSPFDALAPSWHRDRLWYRVMYNLAAATYMCWWNCTFGQKPMTQPAGWPSAWPPEAAALAQVLEEVLAQVRNLAVELIRSADDRRAARTRPWRQGPSAEERSFLLMTRQTTMVLLAAVRWHELAKPAPAPAPAGSGGPQAAPAPSSDRTGKSPTDFDGDISLLIADSSVAVLPPRVHYNLACYFVERWREYHDAKGYPTLSRPASDPFPDPRRPQHLERAWKHLADAIVDRRHAVVAGNDPMLLPLQGWDPDRWDTIMSRGGTPVGRTSRGSWITTTP